MKFSSVLFCDVQGESLAYEGRYLVGGMTALQMQRFALQLQNERGVVGRMGIKKCTPPRSEI